MLIWQQSHPMFFAELDYRKHPTAKTLQKWASVIEVTADFMASFAFWNASTNVYDIGPPMFPVSENTPQNLTVNTAFEISYWHFAFNIAITWMQRMKKSVPDAWTQVDEKMAPRPVQNGTYVIYEGIVDPWKNPDYIRDHPSMSGMYGWLPKTAGLNLAIVNATYAAINNYWNFKSCWGWDFPMLAMQAARMGDPDKAVEWLLHPNYQFDDIGMPVGLYVATPYFPASGGLLYAIAFMAAGWDGSSGNNTPGFGKGWNVQWEGLNRAI